VEDPKATSAKMVNAVRNMAIVVQEKRTVVKVANRLLETVLEAILQ